MSDDQGRRRKPGSVDVARLAGVSQKTVSRVLNSEPYVSAEVRRRVEEAAATLGYRRNGAARALTSGRTHCIGVVTLGTQLYGPVALLMGVERAARRAGYAVRVVNTMEGDRAGLPGAVDALLGQGVDGIVVSEPIDEGDSSVEVDVPVLVFGPWPRITAPDVVTTGIPVQDLAGRATEHLLGLGHATVHHLAGPQRWWSARERLDGWQAALAAGGLPAPPPETGDWSAESGYRAGQRLLADPAVTAVFAGNDEMAIGLVRAAWEAGRRVPGDLSVVGFDDIPLAAYVAPPLTTVRQHFDVMAENGLRRLIHVIEHPGTEPPTPTGPSTELVVRASTAPLRQSTRKEEQAPPGR